MNPRNRLGGLAVATLTAVIAASPVAAASTVDVADVFATDGIWHAGAVDAQGASHVVFSRYTKSGLWYATDKSGGWVTTRISTVTGWSTPALAIDGQGRLHLAIENGGSSPGIHYLTNRTGSWVGLRLLTNSFDRGPSIAVDAAGEVHIVVKETDSDEFNYFTNRRGFWAGLRLTQCSTMESIALDAARRVQIGCGGAAGKAQGIFRLSDASGAWVAERVTSGWHQKPIISTAGGVLRVAFESVSPSGVYVTTRGSTSWGAPVRVHPNALYLGSFLADPAGKSHLVVSGDATWYATNASGGWTSKQVYGGTLSRDGQGTLHLLGGSIALVHTVIGSPGLARTVAGSMSSYEGSHPSLAVDSSGVSHATFWLQFVVSPGIRYGTITGTTWSGTNIRPGDGYDPVIAVEPGGTVHLAYLAAGGTQLWYGRRSGGTWSWTLLSEPDATYECPAIAASPTGHAYLSARRTTTDSGDTIHTPILISDRTASWVTTELPVVSYPGCSAVAANGADKAYLAYDSGVRPSFVTDVSGSFVATGFGQAGDTNPLVALDGNGKVYLTFTRPGNYDSTSVGVFLRTNATGSWVQQNVSRLAASERTMSLDVQADGKVAIAFNGFVWSPLLYLATNRTGSWVTTQILSPPASTLDVAFDPDGNLRLAHSEEGRGIVHLRE